MRACSISWSIRVSRVFAHDGRRVGGLKMGPKKAPEVDALRVYLHVICSTDREIVSMMFSSTGSINK